MSTFISKITKAFNKAGYEFDFEICLDSNGDLVYRLQLAKNTPDLVIYLDYSQSPDETDLKGVLRGMKGAVDEFYMAPFA